MPRSWLGLGQQVSQKYKINTDKFKLEPLHIQISLGRKVRSLVTYGSSLCSLSIAAVTPCFSTQSRVSPHPTLQHTHTLIQPFCSLLQGSPELGISKEGREEACL